MTALYYFNGHLRWTLFWENPNCWAAFLACALPLLWAGQDWVLGVARASRLQTGCVPHPALPGRGAWRGWWRGAWRGSGRPSSAGGTPALPLYALEAGIWFLLVKTYSRGGLVAAVAALVVWVGLRGLRGTGDSPVGLGNTGDSPVGLGGGNTGGSPVPLKPHGRVVRGTRSHGLAAHATQSSRAGSL